MQSRDYSYAILLFAKMCNSCHKELKIMLLCVGDLRLTIPVSGHRQQQSDRSRRWFESCQSWSANLLPGDCSASAAQGHGIFHNRFVCYCRYLFLMTNIGRSFNGGRWHQIKFQDAKMPFFNLTTVNYSLHMIYLNVFRRWHNRSNYFIWSWTK